MNNQFTAFLGTKKLASDAISPLALWLKRYAAENPEHLVLIFNDQTGAQIDVNLTGSNEEIERGLELQFPEFYVPTTQKKGRPKLGVKAREVTLLPRHWQWLQDQPGTTSAALRKLIDDARRKEESNGWSQSNINAVYSVMSAVGGDLAQFEQASRLLFANKQHEFLTLVNDHWPKDLTQYLITRLNQPADYD